MDVRLDVKQWAVCVQLISNAAVQYFQSVLNSGMNVTSVRLDTKIINVPWCHWIWNAKRMTLRCPYTSLGGRQPSKLEFPFLPESIHD